MIKYHYKITYLFNGVEDFTIFSSSDKLSITQIIDFALGQRSKKYFETQEIWELDFDEKNELLPYHFKEKLF